MEPHGRRWSSHAEQGRLLSNEALHIIKEWRSKVLFDHQRSYKRASVGTYGFPPLDKLEALYAGIIYEEKEAHEDNGFGHN